MESILHVRGLHRRYGEQTALDSLDLDLKAGEVLGLLGPNGAGKSTCLRMLSGTLAPDRGEIRIQGLDLLSQPRQAKAHIGYLPDRPPLYTDMRVDEYLDYAARLHGLNGQQRPNAVADARHRCGLDPVGRKLIRQLSLGYQQRLGLAQALVHKPPLLILDEPTVALDPLQIQQIRELIREQARDRAVLLSTHLLPEVQSVCTRVLILHEGRVVHSGPVQDQQTSGLRIGLRQAPSLEILSALPGVEQADRLDARHFMLSGDAIDAAEIARRSVQQDWGLIELTPQRIGLEQVFLRHIAGEQAS